MLQRVWERAKLSRADQVIIATDHDGIRAQAQGFGATVVMTDQGHPSGTDRVSQAVAQHSEFSSIRLVLNIQGDEARVREQYTSMAALGRMVRPTDISDMVLYLCSPAGDNITGQSIDVSGGSHL